MRLQPTSTSGTRRPHAGFVVHGGRALALGLSLLIGGVAAVALAQPGPKGPADLITGARNARRQADMRRAVEATGKPVQATGAGAEKPAGTAPTGGLPSGHPPTGGLPSGHPPTGGLPSGHPPTGGVPSGHPPTGGVPSGHPGVAPGTAAAPGAAAPRLPENESREATELPPGQLRISVRDELRRIVPGAAIELGILRSNGSRDTVKAKAGPGGEHIFKGLPFGDRQAYRVNVVANRARFSSNPFRLPHKHGMHVTVHQLPTTTDRSNVVLYVGAASVELKDERFKVAQQQRFINVGREVYVFPEDGMKVRLPEGATAFQAEETMTDQKVSSDDTHVVIKGSLPPGQTTLLWGFDVPIDGTEQTITLENPFTTFAYRVLADAPKGLALKVKGFPEPELHEGDGKRFLVTTLRRSPDQASLRRIRIELSGIPGPGPLRWIAAALAALAIALGFVFAWKPVGDGSASASTEGLEDAKLSLLEQMRSLERERQAEDIGPGFYADERDRITDELAVVLWQLDERNAD